MNKNSRIVQEWYNQNLDVYTKDGDTLFCDILDEFLSFIPNRGSILDMGSGLGRDVDYFTKKGYVATGIDFSEKMITYAQKNFEGNFIGGNFTNTKFDDNSFNAVWSSSAVLTHLDKKGTNDTLDEIVRIVMPGGILGGIAMQGAGGDIGAISKKGFIFNRYTLDEINEILKKRNVEMIFSRIFEYNQKKWIFFISRIEKTL